MPVQQSTFVSTLAGGASIVAMWALSTFGHITLPGEVASTVTGIIMALLTHYIPDGPQAPKV